MSWLGPMGVVVGASMAARHQEPSRTSAANIRRVPVVRANSGVRSSMVRAGSSSATLRVWSASEVSTDGQVEAITAGTGVLDAGEIVTGDRVLRYGKAAGESAGGLSGFSNLFRYALLLREGGHGVDCDVFCLRPFPTAP